MTTAKVNSRRKNLWHMYSLGCHKRWWTSKACRMGVTSPPPPPPLFWNLSVFLQYVSVKYLDPLLSGNLKYFIIKKTNCRILSISSPTEIKLSPAMTAFKEVIRPSIYDVCNEIFINEQKRWHENDTIIPTYTLTLFSKTTLSSLWSAWAVLK